MSFSDSHIAPVMRHQDADAGIYIPAANMRNPVIASFVPPYASSLLSPVELVCLIADIAKISKAIVRFVMVDVVNHLWLFAVSKKPRNSVGLPVSASKANFYVSAGMILGASNVTSFGSASRNFPLDVARLRVIAKEIADRIRDNFYSHVVPPYDVVRGLVVGATSTPIIPMVSNIGNTEFAQPVCRSGDNPRGPLPINPITL